jgi:HEPN domain-containing protein
MKESIELAKKWIRKAENDFKAVKQLLRSEEILTDAICFHSQQVAEKYLKAFLIYHKIDFPKTHDISFLIEKCKTIDKEFDTLYKKKADFLTEFDVDVRYPEEFYISTEEEAEECFKTSKKVRKFVRMKIKDVVGDE